MVGKLTGWLTYLPGLPNWVSTFQNSIGGSRIMSLTLQDHIFAVAWFSICMKCPSHLMQTILYLGLHFKSLVPGCLFLKYTQSATLNAGLSLVIIFWVAINLFSSNVFFAITKANLCVSRFSIPESVHLLRNIAWVPVVGVRVGWGPCCILRRMVILSLLDLVLSCSWPVPGLDIYPNLWGLFHKASLM